MAESDEKNSDDNMQMENAADKMWMEKFEWKCADGNI